jgi:hypothetical protein
MTAEESERERKTHPLESADEGSSERRKEARERVSGTHVLESAEGRYMSVHQKKATDRWALTVWRV